MDYLNIDNLTKKYDGLIAVDDVSFSVNQGEFLTLLGPSGCGKTTTLRLIAGLEAPTAGNIHIADEHVTDKPAYERDIGMVFQDYALFPHKNVGENVGFPLKMDGVPSDERRERVSEILELVKLPGTEGRPINELSGGQQQRVALARALVQDPDVLLMDEPLSSLDRKLRQELRVEIERIQDEMGITTIYVTHDQLEAFSLSDRVIVLEEGHVEQQGSPIDIYEDPSSEFVGDFIGQSSKLSGEVVRRDGTVLLECTEKLAFRLPSDIAQETGDTVTTLLRAEKLSMGSDELTGPQEVEVTVRNVNYLGEKTVVYCELVDGSELIVSEQGYRLAEQYEPGERATVTIPDDEITVLDGKPADTAYEEVST